MSVPYTVKKGDTLSAIATRHGFKSWQEIYFHDENTAFRAKRPNPNLIHPGDVLILPGRGAAPSPPPVPPTPPAPELPVSSHFVVHRMGSETSFVGRDDQFFFHFIDMKNGLIGIYWFQERGRPKTASRPPLHFVSPSSALTTKGPLAVNKLECEAAYFSREDPGGRLSSTLVLNLSTGAVQCSMPHHLIGPGGRISGGGRNSGGVSTAATGDMRFVRMR